MGGWLTTIMLGLQFLFKFGLSKMAKDERERKRREEAWVEFQEGLKKKDPSKITASLDRLNRE